MVECTMVIGFGVLRGRHIGDIMGTYHQHHPSRASEMNQVDHHAHLLGAMAGVEPHGFLEEDRRALGHPPGSAGILGGMENGGGEMLAAPFWGSNVRDHPTVAHVALLFSLLCVFSPQTATAAL